MNVTDYLHSEWKTILFFVFCQEHCHGLQVCQAAADISSFGEPCPVLGSYLSVEYHCKNGQNSFVPTQYDTWWNITFSLLQNPYLMLIIRCIVVSYVLHTVAFRHYVYYHSTCLIAWIHVCLSAYLLHNSPYISTCRSKEHLILTTWL